MASELAPTFVDAHENGKKACSAVLKLHAGTVLNVLEIATSEGDNVVSKKSVEYVSTSGSKSAQKERPWGGNFRRLNSYPVLNHRYEPGLLCLQHCSHNHSVVPHLR